VLLSSARGAAVALLHHPLAPRNLRRYCGFGLAVKSKLPKYPTISSALRFVLLIGAHRVAPRWRTVGLLPRFGRRLPVLRFSAAVASRAFWFRPLSSRRLRRVRSSLPSFASASPYTFCLGSRSGLLLNVKKNYTLRYMAKNVLFFINNNLSARLCAKLMKRIGARGLVVNK
jgi:hypothetical protein